MESASIFGFGAKTRMVSLIQKVLLFVLLILFSSWRPNRSLSEVAGEIMNQYSEEMKLKNGLLIAGSGGSWTTDIKTIALHFISYQQPDLNSARQFYLKVTASFLSKVNANREIRPYLHDFPFTYLNSDILIAFDKTSGGPIGNGHIALVSTCDGHIYYRTHNESNGRFEDFHEETFEDAIRIVNAEKGLVTNASAN